MYFQAWKLVEAKHSWKRRHKTREMRTGGSGVPRYVHSCDQVEPACFLSCRKAKEKKDQRADEKEAKRNANKTKRERGLT